MKTHRIAWQRTICLIVMVVASALQPAVMNAQGQVRNDSLPEIQVISTRYNVPAISQPQQVLIIGENALASTSARDLVSLLSMYGHAYLRSNGPGLASGLTQRGFGTTSFQIIRDGFALNQPMHGQVDMALIPVATLGFAEIATANASSTFGSAASGGSLLLGNNWKNGWSVSHEAGPWNFRESHGKIVENVGSATLLLDAGVTASENNFLFNEVDSPSAERRENSNLNRKWIHFGSLANSGNYAFRTNVYANKADRGIPDPINFLGTQGNQQDEEVRITAEVSHSGQNARWSVASQVWQSKLLYDDNWLTETSYNRVRGASASLNRNFDPTTWLSMSSAVGGEVNAIQSNNYESATSRNSMQAALRGLVRFKSGLLLFPASRLDVIENVGTALSPSVGLNKAIIPNVLHIRSQWSYNFTAPTLNDQFWVYGGNSDLEAERAHKADIGFHLKTDVGATNIDLQAQTYLTRAKNGIVWQPGVSGMWSPINLQKMHGHGMEQSVRTTTRIGDVGLSFGSQVTWNKSYIPEPRFDGDQAVDKQLRYTPEWMLRFQGGTQYKILSINAEVVHDGKRFTSEGHNSPSDPLPAYTTANFNSQIRLQAGNIEPSFRLSLINAFDVKYSTLAWYPMPGRHLLVALRVSRK